MPEFKTVLYEKIAEHVLRITQNRPEARNAQNLQLTYEVCSPIEHSAAHSTCANAQCQGRNC